VTYGDFRDLEVWHRAMELQRLSHAVARRLPAEARRELGSQIRRAASSVVSDIVEGYGQPTRANYRRYVGMSRASNRELLAHFLCAVNVGYLEPRDVASAIALGDRVGRMLTKLYDGLGPPDC
jgi:four helix bundle protein